MPSRSTRRSASAPRPLAPPGRRGPPPCARTRDWGENAPPLATECLENAHEVLLCLDEPAPGVALIGAYTWGGSVHAAMSFYLFGDRAPAAVSCDEPLWQAWMNEIFTPAAV